MSGIDKFSKIKIKQGVDFVLFKSYYDAVKKAYSESVRYYELKGFDNTVATNLAYMDFILDIQAIEKGEINNFSKIPGFRRF